MAIHSTVSFKIERMKVVVKIIIEQLLLKTTDFICDGQSWITNSSYNEIP